MLPVNEDKFRNIFIVMVCVLLVMSGAVVFAQNSNVGKGQSPQSGATGRNGNDDVLPPPEGASPEKASSGGVASPQDTQSQTLDGG